ncbi:hypothetical protein HRW18_01865 [Streptomyces lunaelactis]|uniref:hypothetical protein n=1 Tax=Streptomyces lunaelactis TaxID=1535768 RepID=UPI0015859FDB|nr:hypothetical protein [Streptomyces lunaelactis]NUK06784.1 hypothetical protein [Streptomyces lunaelactis]NUK57763.1 hypothetical protein [Streptomyces lunaelactis]NUL10461.1 hypothetical protein [Streptomyces lunaelactis]NUL23909.1 hypothetical protein [Streptomyces lunaelactis]
MFISVQLLGGDGGACFLVAFEAPAARGSESSYGQRQCAYHPGSTRGFHGCSLLPGQELDDPEAAAIRLRESGSSAGGGPVDSVRAGAGAETLVGSWAEQLTDRMLVRNRARAYAVG